MPLTSYLIHLAEQDHKEEEMSNVEIAIATFNLLPCGFTVHVLPFMLVPPPESSKIMCEVLDHWDFQTPSRLFLLLREFLYFQIESGKSI